MQIKICKIFLGLKWEKGYIRSYWGSHFKNSVQNQKSILLHCGEKLKRRLKKKGFDTIQGINKISVQFLFSLQGLCT